jgi:hypothetical protein
VQAISAKWEQSKGTPGPRPDGDGKRHRGNGVDESTGKDSGCFLHADEKRWVTGWMLIFDTVLMDVGFKLIARSGRNMTLSDTHGDFYIRKSAPGPP